MTDKFWTEDFNVLLQHPMDILPKSTQTLNEKLNALTRLVMYGSVMLWAIGSVLTPLVIGVVILIVIFVVKTYYVAGVDHFTEPKRPRIAPPDLDPFSRTECEYPTESNPWMNMSPYDLGSNNEFLPACRGPEIEKEAEAMFQKGTYDDPYDLFGTKSNNSRQWRTVPKHVTPESRDFYLKWRFKGYKTCKEDSRYCSPNWHGGQQWV